MSTYQHADILYYTRAILWAAPTAITKVINSEKLTSVPKFPSVKELNDIFNLCPNQFNPFIHNKLPSMGTEKEFAGNQDNSVINVAHAIALPTISPMLGDLRSYKTLSHINF